MSIRLRQVIATAAAVVAFASPVAAQQRAGIMGDLMKDVSDVQGKLTALAKAMPADKYDWRPGVGVRSVGEVFMHVSADNYFMPSAVGFMPDASSGVNPKDFKTLTAFEKQKMTPAEAAATIDKSFVHLKQTMSDTPDAKLDEHVKFFGQDMTVRQVWVATATHLHEHLGQAIAYARMNGVTPPWSK
ncbi:MAG: DinB family protein [Gemmatimonadaceae bacterium]